MSKILLSGLVAALVALGLPPGPGQAARTLRAVATIPDLKALAATVGGDLVDVESLARGNQNAHELEIRPSLMLKVRRADVFVQNGLELDTWADVVIQGANNPAVMPGAPGAIDASRGIPVLDVPATRVDRSMGDVHPLGNPHYTLDPGLAPIVTQNIVDGFARVAPEHRAAFERNRQQFLARLEEALVGWRRELAPFKSAPVVVYHPMWVYFLSRFGLVQVGAVEDRPGIPPSPAGLARLARTMKDHRVRVIIVEPWNDQKLAARVAEEAGTGARAVVLASMVGGIKGADTYIAAIDYNVKTLAAALR